MAQRGSRGVAPLISTLTLDEGFVECENKVCLLRRIFCPERQDVTGGFRKV
jgi:hypothetical protein